MTSVLDAVVALREAASQIEAAASWASYNTSEEDVERLLNTASWLRTRAVEIGIQQTGSGDEWTAEEHVRGEAPKELF